MAFTSAISWFEIPTSDISRAQKFYESIFGITMTAMDTPKISMRMFPTENPMNVGGALVFNSQFYKPSATDGPLVYLNGNPDVQEVLDRVEAAGGTVSVGKTEISPEHGYMAVIVDSEGNRVALHSVPQ
jgi:predicted enzyme related to lactoylglutathione lyase